VGTVTELFQSIDTWYSKRSVKHKKNPPKKRLPGLTGCVPKSKTSGLSGKDGAADLPKPDLPNKDTSVKYDVQPDGSIYVDIKIKKDTPSPPDKFMQFDNAFPLDKAIIVDKTAIKPDSPTPDAAKPDKAVPDLQIPDVLKPDIKSADIGVPKIGWEKGIHGSSSGITVDNKGYVYVTGYKTGLWVAKFDPKGKIVWSTIGNSKAGGGRIVVDSKGNSYVVGSINYDIWYGKFNPNGKLLWEKTYNGKLNSSDFGSGIALGKSNTLFLTGSSCETGGHDVWLMKCDTNGKALWPKPVIYDNPKHTNDIARDIALDKNDNAYLAGATWYPQGSIPNSLLLKYSSSGKLLWSKFDKSNSNHVDYSGIELDKGGNIFLSGTHESNPWNAGYNNIRVEKLDPKGKKIWSTDYNGLYNSEDNGNDIAIDQNGNSYIAGGSFQAKGHSLDYWVGKFSPKGKFLWTVNKMYGGLTQYEYASGVAVGKSGSVFATGYIWQYTYPKGHEQTIIVQKITQ